MTLFIPSVLHYSYQHIYFIALQATLQSLFNKNKHSTTIALPYTKSAIYSFGYRLEFIEFTSVSARRGLVSFRAVIKRIAIFRPTNQKRLRTNNSPSLIICLKSLVRKKGCCLFDLKS